MAEEWRIVPGWPYEVSDLGRVRRASPGRGSTHAGRLLKPTTLSHGYQQVMLVSGPARKKFSVHRLVATCFALTGLGDQINHRDGDKANNAVPNLEWVTVSENHLHAFRTGLRRGKSESGPAKLTRDAARTIRVRAQAGEPYARIAADFQVTPQTVGDIKRGRTWQE